MNLELYNWLLETATSQQWQQVGIQRRAGVVVPLFSIYSHQSLGIGEFTDLLLLIDWCRKAGLSIIQLLPLNDVGFNFTPYDAQSSLALEPMYLNFPQLVGSDLKDFSERLRQIAQQIPAGKPKVDYSIKRTKYELLWDIFQSPSCKKKIPAFQNYIEAQNYWLHDYALYRIIKANFWENPWFAWPEEFKHRHPEALMAFSKSHSDLILFQKWLQWQTYEQMKYVKSYAESQGVKLMGDIPFLVARDSADVWANQSFFKLYQSAGSPPDMYFAKGQRWGMPPYDWEAIAAQEYSYFIQKFKYAENFYDLFRIDHFVGIFRLWTISLSEPEEHAGLYGAFDPASESQWEEHGKKLLDAMLANTHMLPCAEDLGTVPDCSYKITREYGIVGTDIQRWARDWKGNMAFKPAEEYRINGIATLATHDLPGLQAWWEQEAGTVDELLFRKKCDERGWDLTSLKEQLFQTDTYTAGRLHWKDTITEVNILLTVLKRPAEEVRDWIELFQSTYDEKEKFWQYIEGQGPAPLEFNLSFAQKVLEKINQSASIFSIQLLMDWVSVRWRMEDFDGRNLRINTPGKISNENWSMVLPFALEELLTDPVTEMLLKINQKTQRC